MASNLLSNTPLQVEASSARQEENVSDLKEKSWLELCEAASREQDPEKLLELITTLNDLLEERELEEKAKQCTCTMAWGTKRTASGSQRIAA